MKNKKLKRELLWFSFFLTIIGSSYGDAQSVAVHLLDQIARKIVKRAVLQQKMQQCIGGAFHPGAIKKCAQKARSYERWVDTGFDSAKIVYKKGFKKSPKEIGKKVIAHCVHDYLTKKSSAKSKKVRTIKKTPFLKEFFDIVGKRAIFLLVHKVAKKISSS